MYGVVWEFRVRAGAEAAFVAGYGSEGAWVRLFRRAEGFERTVLAQSMQSSVTFYTLDFWESETHYANFRQIFASEYASLDGELEGLTEGERLVGVLFHPSAASKKEEMDGEGKV